MNIRTTLLLLLTVILLAGGIVWLNRHASVADAQRDSKLLLFDRNRLDQIEVRYNDGRVLGLAQRDGVWKLMEPFEDAADPVRVQSLLEELSAVEYFEGVERAEFAEADWQKTGLDEPLATLRLLSKSEQLLKISIGRPAMLNHSSYMTLGDGKGQVDFVAKTRIHQLLADPASIWRDMTLLRLPAESVTGLRIILADGQIELKREALGRGDWQMIRPLQTRASDERVQELLSVLLNLEIIEVEPRAMAATLLEGAADGASKNRIFIECRDVHYEVKIKKPTSFESGVTHAMVSHRAPLFQVRSEALALVWNPPNALRDDFLARVDADKVERIGIDSSAFPSVTLRKENGSWYLNRFGREAPANGDRVNRFFEALKTTKVLGFAADSAADLSKFGLAEPFLTVWWAEGDGEPQRLFFGDGGEKLGVFAKHEDEPFIYQVGSDVLNQFPADSLKWKGRGVLGFSQFDLNRIVLSIGAAPPITLRYDATTANWAGKVADQDVTHLVDRVKADALASALGRLTAESWTASIAEGIEALKDPAVTLRISLRRSDEGQIKEHVHELRFAPTQAGMDTTFYYGRLDEEPDVFYISRVVLRSLLSPVFKSADP